MGAYRPVLRSLYQPHQTFDSHGVPESDGRLTQRRTAPPPVILGEEISLTTDPLAMGEGAAAEAGSSQENQEAFSEA